MNIEQVLFKVEDERFRQDKKFGANEDRNLGAATRYRILLEECGEVANELEFDEAGGEVIDTDALRSELVQVAACCMAWLEALGTSRFSAVNSIRVEAIAWGKYYPSSPPNGTRMNGACNWARNWAEWLMPTDRQLWWGSSGGSTV